LAISKGKTISGVEMGMAGADPKSLVGPPGAEPQAAGGKGLGKIPQLPEARGSGGSPQKQGCIHPGAKGAKPPLKNNSPPLTKSGR